MGIVHQVLLMRQLCRPFIEAEIVAAGRFQALMAENFFDMTHRAAIEEKLLGCRVPCGRTGLFNPASLRCRANGHQISPRSKRVIPFCETNSGAALSVRISRYCCS
jgi:hypothetical protein